jgi:hypothetical protein
VQPFYGSADAVKAAEDATGTQLYQPQTTAGKYADTATQFLVGGKAAGMKAAPALTAGLASEAAGQATEGTGYEPVARIVGGIAGGMARDAASELCIFLVHVQLPDE